ncbi:MAG: efflux RND transporter permease subunit [Raineya sp.]
MFLQHILQRPVGVLMSFLIILIFSSLAFFKLPVSLLPEADVPQIIIKVSLPNASPAEIEQNILRPIRDKMLTIPRLKDIRSEANSENGLVELFFEYGTQMQYAYLEANEKIDQLTQNLPRNLPRPQVIRINTADVPIIRLQVIPTKIDLLAASELTERVIKKRLEALAGVSMVDINGMQRKIIGVRFKYEQLNALQLTEKQVLQVIQENNQELGAISVLEGQYRYFLKFNARLSSINDLEKLAINTPKGNVIPITQVADFEETTEQAQAIHLSNLQESLVLTLHKQADAQMDKLMPLIETNIQILQKEYPYVSFRLSQNQYNLLEAGISNLQNDLFWGGLFAFLILFIFIGNYQVPFIIGVILPSSLVMSFLVFWVFGTSINIVSLSGLALGLGMTIDNAIIIFDNISKKRLQGQALLQACVEGTAEMFAPLFSSGLTTLAVFIPLVFLSGLAGAFTTDQAISVGAILATSLLVSCILLPLLYLLFFQKSQSLPKEDTRLYLFLLKVYKKIVAFLFKKPTLSFYVFLLIGVLGLGIAFLLPIEGLTEIKRNDVLLKINWNEPISLAENEQRIKIILEKYKKHYDFSEADIGISQFLFRKEAQTLQEAELYINFKKFEHKKALKKDIKAFLLSNFPQARFQITDAPNVFDLIFRSKMPYYEAKIRNINPSLPVENEKMQQIASKIKAKHNALILGKGLQTESQVKIEIQEQALALHQVSRELVLQKLKNMFSEAEITTLKNFGTILPIRLIENKTNFQQKLEKSFVRLDSNSVYPLSSFIQFSFTTDYKTICADKTGIFHGLEYNQAQDEEIQQIGKEISKEVQKNNLQVDFAGQYFENRENLQQLFVILLISVALLYLILTVEFESLRQPLIVLLTLPLGFTGSLIGLWIGGASLNVMSAIGLVVMLGIIDNEAILKIDTINRLRKQMPLDEAISKAGEICFKPVLMTSLTNILALTPFLFDTGIGGDLQRPFVLAIIGGLSFGTFTALFFVSLAYRVLAKK